MGDTMKTKRMLDCLVLRKRPRIRQSISAPNRIARVRLHRVVGDLMGIKGKGESRLPWLQGSRDSGMTGLYKIGSGADCESE